MPLNYTLKMLKMLPLTWVEWHLVAGACLISAGDKATPCLSQLGFWFVPMPGSCPGHVGEKSLKWLSFMYILPQFRKREK